jgi:hypothetical protein
MIQAPSLMAFVTYVFAGFSLAMGWSLGFWLAGKVLK